MILLVLLIPVILLQKHIPVLVKEVLYFLDVRPGRRFIDATVGGGGHTEAILKLGGEVLGIDVSQKALRLAEERIRKTRPGTHHAVHPPKVRLVQGNFRDILQIAQNTGFKKVDGILFDLGVASFELSDPTLGLSFLEDEPLDMRLDPTLGVRACDLVNILPENELYKLFYEIAQEKYAWQIARAICIARSIKPFEKTGELARLIEEIYGGRKNAKRKTQNVKRFAYHVSRLHPATRVFMALRIAVNLEFENLGRALPQALGLLKPGGKLAVISFHSGEDRIVKRFFKEEERKRTVRLLTRKPVMPSSLEIKENPRSRSAKLRAIEKIMEKQRLQKTKEKINKTLLVAGILIAAAIGGQLAVTHILAGRGGELANLDREAIKIARENQILQEELDQKSALSRIASESGRLGLVKPEKVLYLPLSWPGLAALPQ